MRRGQGSMISVPFLIACLQAETAGRIWMKRMMIAALCLLLCGCQSVQEDTLRVSQTEDAPAQLVAEQVLEGESGTIHYSYQLPEGYHETGSYPMMVVMPGYDMMWFGEDSSGANLDWQGFRCWSDLDEEIIVVSAQLTDWGETSARQAIELTEHFLDDFAVDAKRVYAAGYSAGGETMSRAVSMRPDLYAAYLHAASQWDGDLVSVTAHDVGVYIYIGSNDEYYGSQQAQDTYDALYAAYQADGRSDEQIASLLQIQMPDDAYFAQQGAGGYANAAANVVFDDDEVLNWIIDHHK